MMFWTLLFLSLQAVAFPDTAGEPLKARTGFNAAAQHVSTSGAHAFVPPGPSDLRGPCPGINALANHGYLPHNGVGTATQYIEAISSVYGVGVDLAGFLGVFGSVISGDLTKFSMGGEPPASLLDPITGVLLGRPEGISNSHDKFEGDASPTRGDLYISNNDFELVMDNFKELYAYQASKSEAESNYDLDVLTQHRVARFQNSVSKNPNFFYGPFTGPLASPAAFTFIYRLMGNKSAEYPEGRMSKENLKSFFGITGDSPSNFVYKAGHERIPDNFYRRAIGDEYGMMQYFEDVLAAGAAYPQLFDIGGNTGTPNSFTGVNVEDLTGGLYNAKSLANGNNFACFSFQLLQQAIPDLVKGVLADAMTAVDMMSQPIAAILGGLECENLPSGTYGKFQNEFQKFPGFTKAQSH